MSIFSSLYHNIILKLWHFWFIVVLIYYSVCYHIFNPVLHQKEQKINTLISHHRKHVFTSQALFKLSKQFSGPILLAIHMPDDFYLFLEGFVIIFRTFTFHFSDLIRWTLHMAMCPISSSNSNSTFIALNLHQQADSKAQQPNHCSKSISMDGIKVSTAEQT